jgi:hypothetical protein
MPLILLPAVDVVEGRAVRLVQGKAGSETEYGSALDAALGWQRDGGEWIHLVDLDAAFGRGSNRELLAEVVGKLDVHVELSGGIRDDDSLTAALNTGCTRVNLGTAALENPSGARGPSPSTATKSPSGWMCKSLMVRTGCADAAGKPMAEICGRCWNVLTVRDVRGSSSPMSPRTAHWVVPISNCWLGSPIAPMPRSSRPVGYPAWTTCALSPP